MAEDLLEARVRELEKKIEAILFQLNGVATSTQLSRLTAIRQTELEDIKQQLDRLTAVVKNHLMSP